MRDSRENGCRREGPVRTNDGTLVVEGGLATACDQKVESLLRNGGRLVQQFQWARHSAPSRPL